MAINLLNDLNIVGNPTLLLQNRNCETIGVIANPSGLKYKDNFNSANELSFTTYKFIDNVINPLWDKLKDLKIVSIPDYKVRFQIEPTTSEENNLSKSIVGTELCQAELSQISLRNIYINTSEDILNNDYDENLPTVFYRNLNNYNAYDWLWEKHRYEYLKDTTLYSTEESVIKEKKRILARASMLHRLLEKAPNYTIGHIDDSLRNIQRQLTVDGSSIYDTLTQTVAETFGCVFIFDSWTRTINAYDLYNTCANDDCDYLKTYGVRYRADFNDCCPKCGSKNIKGKYGEITPTLINSRNIAKQIQLKSNTDELKNCFYISGGDDLISSTISNINPNGSRYIYYFSDDIKSDMPTELVDKLNSYEKLTKEMNQSHTFVISKELIDSYNAVVDYINERFTETTVDEDGVETKKEKFKKQPYSLVGYPATTDFMYDAIDLYYFLHDSMYPVLEISEFSLQESLDSIVNGFSKGFETEDGTVFKNQIAVQNSGTLVKTTIENNIEDLAQLYYSKAYYDITVNTKTYEKATKDANGKWVGYITLTSKTQKDENDQYIHGDTSDITLEIIDSSEQLELFITQKIYRAMSNADDLKDKQLTSFNLSDETFKKDIELYSLSELENILKEFEACRNIITTSFDKGTIDSDNGDTLKKKYYTFYYNRISMLNDEIAVRQNQIDDVCKIYSIQDGAITGELADLRSTVNAALNLEKYLGTDLWKLLHCYIREDDYRNENYKSDGLETNSELIKRCQQLYDVACENLYKAGTLQYQLTTSINNLLVLPEFKPLIKHFNIGNFLNVEIDNKVYLLRLLSYEINYDSLNDLSVEFSTVEKIYRGYSDIKSVLQKASSMATSFSSISSQVEESSKTSDVINDWTKNGITGDQEIKDSTDKNLVIDKNGILARSKNENSNDYDPHQLKILHSGLYTTSDNWKTTDAGIGKFTYKDINGNTIEDYGIIAKTVVGNLIIGKNLQIFSEDKSVIIDSSGLTIDGGVLKIIGKDISGEGVTISEVIIDLDTAKKLAELAKSTADTANNTANTAKDTADKAQESADKANQAAEDLKVETNEIRELAEKGVDHVTTYFYQSDSATELVGGEWTTNSVTWVSGKYVWQKVITYYKDGTDNSQTAKAICISGANGQDGKPGENGVKGKGVKSITPQYAISDSNVIQPTEGWSDTEPTWSEGKYIWTRTLVVYDDDTQETTKPVVSNGLNSALSISTAARKQADSAKSTADSANTTASEAKSTADSASQTANKASENATSAVEKANTANTNASSALTTATSANKTANDASSKADSATKTANSASEKADAASKDASSAIETSNIAKSTADNAKSVADTAKGLVDDVKTDLSTNYSTTKQVEKKIDDKADSITTSITETVSETYETKSDSSQKLTDAKSYADGVGSTTLSSANETAKGYADTAEKNANTNTANQLKSYSKTTEVESKIEQSANAIKQTVSETYVSNTTYETDINKLQGQIDGNIQSWSGTDVPTLDNEPASTWSDDEKVTHIGDIYYDGDSHAYRFRVDNGVYSWQILTDTDVTKALSDSADAISKANATEKKLLTDYKTASDTSSEIEQTKNGILQTVKDTYAESATVTDLSNDLKTNYSTTKDMNSAISEKADEITLAVSETYSTKKTVEENLATSKSYADGVGSKTLESAKTDATTKANQAKSDAIADTDKKLTSYSTTEQMNAAIKTSADNITSTVSKTYSTKEEVANIQVGGRNLIAISTSIDNKRIIENYNYDNLYTDTGFRTSALISCKEGDSFTLSSFAEGFLSFGWINSDKNVFSRPTGYMTVNSKYSRTFIAPSGTVYCAVSWSKNNLDHNIKLEKGNKATDWTPAPEDVSSDISTAKADAISSANASTDEKLKSYETIENVNSKISQSATDITSTVKKTYETIDNVNKVRTSVTEAETKAQQSLDQFLWLVKSGSSSTSLTLTDSAITAITKQFTITSPDGTSTIIEGGKLKTDALKSNNYIAGDDGTYSAFGTFIDLADGSIHTPGFYLDRVGNAFYKGTVNATAGYFGNDENNWYIGTAEFSNIRNNNDVLVNNVDYSALISKGNAALTAGDWYLMSQESGLGVQSGWTTINGGNYVFDKETQKYYDMGMVEPIFDSKNEWDDKFLYIRRVKDPSSSQATWEYLFKVDKDGTIFENGTKLSDKYARKDAVGSTYLPLTGGTVTGNLTVNGTLTATASKANQLNHTLSVNGKSWNGSADLTVGTIGVTYGGTGKSSWTANGIVYASASGTLSQLALGTAGYLLQSGGTSAPSWVNPSTLNVASATKATQDGNGNIISDTYLRKDFDSVSQNVSFGGSVDVDDLTAGTLLVSGVARFANGLIGNLKGTASNVPWSGITDKPSTFTPSAHTHTMSNISDWETYVYNAQSTRTKNTVLVAPNGTDGKATFRALVEADIPTLSKSKVGLGNVDNTADSAKSVLSARKLTTARNITIGSVKKSFDGTLDISFSLADIGAAASGHAHNYASKVTLAGTDYSCVSNEITITKANLQTAIGSTGLGLMTAEERSKLDSIKVSSGGTIDFSGVTASGALTATIGTDKSVAITHNTSGVKAGTYKSVTVDTYGHVTAGANPTTLSGYGITDALSSSTKYALSDSVGGNALKANLLASLGRLTDANITVTGSGGVTTFKASSSMTANKPPKEGHVLHFYWDNKNNWDSQMCISADSSPTVYVRGMTGKVNTYGDWKTLLDSTNYSNYTVKKDGTGASGTWGIDITGNAATATKAISADSATKAIQDENGNVISSTYLPLTGGSMTGTIISSSAAQIIRWTSSATDKNTTGCSWYGLGIYKADDGYNWLNISNYGGINFTTANSKRFTHNGNIIITSANIGSQSVASAIKATQDGAGNVITSKYVTIDTTQTISGVKTFSKETTISSATASTSKTTGALKVKGGIASEGQISADKVMIGDKCTLEYDANLQCLNFVFA